MTPAVELDELRVVRTGNVALDGLSLAVPRAPVTGLLAPSGRGKTTLLGTIVGFGAALPRPRTA